MEDMEDTGKNSSKGFVTGFNLKLIASKTDDFSQWPSLAVASSLSYVKNSQNANKPPKIPDNGSSQNIEKSRSFTTPQNETLASQKVNGVVTGYCKTSTVSEGKTKICLDKDKQGFASDWLLSGKSLQHPPDHWNPDYSFRRRSSSEPDCKSSKSNETTNLSQSGLQTCPPAARRSSSSELHQRPPQTCGNFFSTHRHRLPAFSPRPLGQPWMNYSERQRSRNVVGGEVKKPLDEMLPAGVRQSLSPRQGGSPRRYTPTSYLRRSSSHDNLRNRVSRSRSSSLPVPNKLHESRVVMEWKEKRTGGVTYVTPFLQTLGDEPEDSQFKGNFAEDQGISCTQDCCQDES